MSTVDEIRMKLAEHARELLAANQYAILIVLDADTTAYSTENFDPSVLPGALRELADKIESVAPRSAYMYQAPRKSKT
jgi:predicted pyridoxine 5'-phosphate oxidase superfamily flavin-nucleotide-binding protein